MLVFLFALYASSSAIAQKPVLNHIAQYVQNLNKSTTFYRDIIGLDTIPEPFHDGKHTWLAIGGNSALHLIAGNKDTLAHPKNSHLCFNVASLNPFIERLSKAGIPYEDWEGKQGAVTLRVDGVKQIYFKDPDGYWIEMNDARK